MFSRLKKRTNWVETGLDDCHGDFRNRNLDAVSVTLIPVMLMKNDNDPQDLSWDQLIRDTGKDKWML